MRYLPLLLLMICCGTACRTENTTDHQAEATTPPTSVSTRTAYIGTYTRTENHVDGKAAGIYQVQVDPTTGLLSEPIIQARLTNPSFLRKSADGRNLYSVSQLSHDDEPTGFVHAYQIVGDSLREVNRVSSNSKSPCHVEIDKTDQWVVVTNYLGGVATVYQRLPADGALAEADRFVVPAGITAQRASWVHSSCISPDNRLVAFVDKGLDRVWMCYLDQQSGKLTPHETPWVTFAEGDGPRHAAWSADGRFLYVINELSNSVTVIAYAQADNTFEVLQTIPSLPEGFTEKNTCADIHLHPSGQFLYGSNRGHNSIVTYTVDQQTGRLTLLEHTTTRGAYPRNFALSPAGDFLYAANQNTDNIAVYRVEANGRLTFSGQDFAVKTPVCIAW